MKTPRQLLNTLKKQGLNPFYISTCKRLLFEMLVESGLDLFKNMDDILSDDLITSFNYKVKRILNDEPLGYVLGYEWFYGYKITVDNHVLIPRSETEELVGYVCEAIDEYFDDESVVICDIATGSGAIAVALKNEISNSKVIASDISSEAIEIAKRNAQLNDADVDFHVGDMALPLIESNIKVDVCVCNPPYIKSDENIELSVKDYEPHVALFGGQDGLDLYRRLLDQLPSILKDKAIVAFEIGYDQKEALLVEIESRFNNVKVISKKDINQKDRMIFLYF
jgi:release factor glutamine methyltransferase